MGSMKTILLLDDNKYVLDILSISLRAFLKDCTVLTASNGASGMELLRSRDVDLILTDLDMPIMNGYVFIKLAKEVKPGVPVCVMTGECSPEIEQKLRPLGVRWCIEKPFQIDELTRRISEELYMSEQAQGENRLSDFPLRYRHPQAK